MNVSYKRLLVWQKSMKLTVLLYELLEIFPKSELFGLTSQMKRAVISIPSNIAEGSKRKGQKEFVQYLRIAYGSAAEIETQLEIAKQLHFITTKDCCDVEVLLFEVLKMLNVFIAKVSTQK